MAATHGLAKVLATPTRNGGGLWVAAPLLFGVLLAPYAGMAQEATPSKSEWLNKMRTAVPTSFCRDKQYFRQCFDVERSTCEKTAASATRTCIRKLESEMPDTFNRERGRKWGQRLGECAGRAYEVSLSQKRIESDKCNNVENWR